MSSTKVLIVPALAVLLLAGCADTVCEVPESQNEPTFYIGKLPPEFVQAMSTEELRTFHGATEQTVEAARRIIENADSWDVAHRKVSALLAKRQHTPAARQFIAARMIEQVLLDAPASEARPEAIGTYTEILLHHENPDASIILPALRQLEGYWSAGRLSEATQTTKDLARAYLEGNPDLLTRGQVASKTSDGGFKSASGAEDAQLMRLLRIEHETSS